jgi:nitronate monooxygenase
MREWEGRETELRARREEVLQRLREGQAKRDPEVESLWVGQGAGFVRQIRPAAEIVTSISDAAERILRQRPSQILA